MKCLSVRQPWAHLIVTGRKDVENRSWQCRLRGPILIHAGLKEDREALITLERAGYHFGGLVRGAIIGMAEIYDCLPPRKARSKWHQDGMWGLYLRKMVRFARPIAWRGQLYFFDVPDESVPEARLYLREYDIQEDPE